MFLKAYHNSSIRYLVERSDLGRISLNSSNILSVSEEEPLAGAWEWEIGSAEGELRLDI